MILVDTSAWVEFLRNTGSPICHCVDELFGAGAAIFELATCDVIRMEVLAGARSEKHLKQLHGLFESLVYIPTQPDDYDHSAELYRLCRNRGDTVRKMNDCLIASVAIRNFTSLLHRDADFDVIARHTALNIYQYQ